MFKIHPLPGKILTPDKVSSLYHWPEKTWIRANMVQSIEANVIDNSGSTDELTNEIDKFIFRTLRQLSDVVLIGAHTAVKNKYQDIKISSENKKLRRKFKLAMKPRLAIISNNLKISQDFFKNWSDLDKPMLFTHERNKNQVQDLSHLSEIIFCGQNKVNLKLVKKNLKQRSFNRILCEGGPTLLNSMFGNNLIDELDLTLQVKLSNSINSFKIAQGPHLKPAVELKPIQVIQHEKTLLLRYLVQGHKL